MRLKDGVMNDLCSLLLSSSGSCCSLMSLSSGFLYIIATILSELNAFFWFFGFYICYIATPYIEHYINLLTQTLTCIINISLTSRL